MPNLMPLDILPEVRQVLVGAARGSAEPPYLTAYQILSLLPATTRDRLIAERTLGGAGAGVSYAAPNVVADAAQRLPGIDIRWIDTRGLRIQVEGQPLLTPGYEVAALYRLIVAEGGEGGSSGGS